MKSLTTLTDPCSLVAKSDHLLSFGHPFSLSPNSLARAPRKTEINCRAKGKNHFPSFHRSRQLSPLRAVSHWVALWDRTWVLGLIFRSLTADKVKDVNRMALCYSKLGEAVTQCLFRVVPKLVTLHITLKLCQLKSNTLRGLTSNSKNISSRWVFQFRLSHKLLKLY